MSTNPVAANPASTLSPLSLRELTELLIKHHQLQDGLYELLVEFQIGMGTFGPTQADAMPGATVGLSKIGLIQVSAMGNTTVDAAKINPPKKPAKKKLIKTTKP
jgi:hypothetical protein